MVTRQGSELRWGREPSNRDALVEAPVRTKLEHLRLIHQQYQRIDANRPWLDLRYDHVTYPVQTAEMNPAGQS
jgi:hypothetical protein